MLGWGAGTGELFNKGVAFEDVFSLGNTIAHFIQKF
jgi:hypothetical protein